MQQERVLGGRMRPAWAWAGEHEGTADHTDRERRKNFEHPCLLIHGG